VRQGIYKALAGCLLWLCLPSLGHALRLAVVAHTPDAANVQNLEAVLQGIRLRAGAFNKVEIPAGATDIQALLDNVHPDKIIALDKGAAELTAKTTYRYNAIAGLFPFDAKEFNGISLTMDINAVTERLARLTPAIKRVFIVQQKGFLSFSGNPKAGASPVVVMLEGQDSLTTIRLLSHTIEQEATTSDAVFIPPNVPDDIMFKIGLSAWDKKIKLLSVNMWHLENGVLMIFFPEPVALGERLAEQVVKPQLGYSTVTNIAAGLNRRLAQHHDVDFTPETENQFEVKIK
jgi:hypothetical protein